MTNEGKLFFLDQHGCAKNQVDGELIISELVKLNWARTETPEEASLIIVNSCGFIESAKKESIEACITAHNGYPKAKVLLAGCLAERYAKEFETDFNEVDAIFGNGDISRLGEVINQLFTTNTDKKPVLTPLQKGVCAGARSELLGFPNSAFVKITEGCNNCCSFCAIPVIRGELRSRSTEDIVAEIKTLLNKGIFEINLIGQDLAAFGRDGVPKGQSNHIEYKKEPSPLALILKQISALSGHFWVRLLYIHPDHFPYDILPIIESDSRLLPYFDIPFQSGCDKTIKAMNRTGPVSMYKELVQKIRNLKSKNGSAALRTTFLCGFPGETEEDFNQTVDFLKTINPDWSGCFEYSKEEDTVAYNLKKQVPHTKAKKRTELLTTLQTTITTECLSSRINKDYDVLIEEIIDDPEENIGLALGRAWFQVPEVDGATVVRYNLDVDSEKAAIKPGNVVKVRLTDVSGVDVSGFYLP